MGTGVGAGVGEHALQAESCDAGAGVGGGVGAAAARGKTDPYPSKAVDVEGMEEVEGGDEEGDPVSVRITIRW